MPTEHWAPSLSDVARHIPTRTRDTRSPGSDRLLGTFTPDTTPNDGQAALTIDGALQSVLSQAEGLIDPADAEICAQARVAVEWRAAADIELAYPGRDADVRVYMQLDARAKDELRYLLIKLGLGPGQGAQDGPPPGTVVWRAPPPPPWADRDPDYREPGWRRAPAAGVGGYVIPAHTDTPPGGG